MAHELAHAPAELSADFALRWAQVMGVGGSDRLARAVASTRLGREFTHDEFWTSVIHLFVNNPRIDLAQVDPIVEYLYHQKFHTALGDHRRGYPGVPRSPAARAIDQGPHDCLAVCGRVVEWQAEPKEVAKKTLIRWARSSIGEFVGRDEVGRDWTIRELVDSDAIAAEATAMEHCVAGFTDHCARRLTTIWSAGIETSEGRRRVATIEVNPTTRALVQAKTRCNGEPDGFCLAILSDWAEREGLKLGLAVENDAEVGELAAVV